MTIGHSNGNYKRSGKHYEARLGICIEKDMCEMMVILVLGVLASQAENKKK